MARLTRRHLLAAGVTAGGLALIPGTVRAERRGSYRLVIEQGIDPVSVRAQLTARLGAPQLIGRIAKDVQNRPSELRAVAKEISKERTIVVASAEVATALEGLTGRSISRNRAIASELSRALPAHPVELMVVA